MKKFSAAILAAACITGIAAAPASAKSDDIRVQVNFADINIGSDAGAAVLANRIEANVIRACARAEDNRQLKQVAKCREQLISAAVEELENKGASNVAGHLARG